MRSARLLLPVLAAAGAGYAAGRRRVAAPRELPHDRGHAAARGRRRPVAREGARPRPRRALRRGDARARAPAPAARGRPAPRGRAGRDRRRVPADRRPRHRPARGRRGPRPLDARRARPGLRRDLHRRHRAQRRDRRPRAPCAPNRLRAGRGWRAEIPGAEDLTVAVNVSAKQIAHGELFGEVREALRDTGLPPAALTVEVTESALMEESDAPGAVLATLRTLGTRVVLDDFGTGHSSLSYLRRVETREQADRLRALHCRLGQGYLLARPLPAADATALLTRRLADVTAGRAGDTVR